MRRVWDALIAIVVAIIVINALMAMIKPYVPWLIIGGFVFWAAKTWFIHSRNW